MSGAGGRRYGGGIARCSAHFYVHRPVTHGYVIAFSTDVSSQARSRPRITRDVDDAVRERVLETLAAK